MIMNNCFRPLAIVGLLLMFSVSLVFADYYQYTDSSGTVVMVDDVSKIPRRYRNQVSSSKSDSIEEKVTAVRVRKNQVRVPVRLNYRNNTVDAWMVLDTGATMTMISGSLANRLGIRPHNAEPIYARVADGSVVTAYKTRVDYIAVGPKLKNNPEVAIMPVNSSSLGFGDGLLGMNFLGDFRYHIDMNSQIIEWQ